MKTFSRRSMCTVALALLTLGGGRAHADDRIAGATSQLVAAGKTHALFIKWGTSASSWGSNGSGELGNKTTSSSATSTPVSYLGKSPRQVSAGDAFTVALDQTGRLWTCGKSDKGQTGQGAKASPLTVPTLIGGTGDVYTSVAAGTSHAAAISTHGLLSVWGDNAKGEVGNGSTASVITKGSVGSLLNDRWLFVTAGNQFTAALKSDGSAWTWGHGTSGQLGINGTADKNTPQPVTSTTPWVALSAGDSHVLGIKADGTLWAWGLNDKAQIGDSTLATTALQKTPLQITSPSGSWLAVSAGGHDSFALRSDGTLWAWGDNGVGQLGISNSNATVNTPTQVGSGGWQYVKAGYDFTIGVMADGNVFTWGKAGSGQLGNGSTSNTTVPGAPIFYAAKQGMVSGGAMHAADLRTSGVVTTYGSPGAGALGQSADQLAECSTYACPQPGSIASPKAWRMVATGADQTLGIKSDGTLWAWGGNSTGDVGNGHTTPQATPVQIGTSKLWAKVFAGPTSTSSFALRADGTLYAWGGNGVRQLGTSTSGTKTAPTTVSGSKRWVTVSTGGLHTMGITADGKLWVWGNNDYGELGVDYNTVQEQATPMQVGASTTWLSVSAGEGVSSAINADNDVYSWGRNDNGELGNGNYDWTSTPTKNGSLSGIVSICRTSVSALVVNASGVISGWGGNYSGELGTGDTNGRLFPVGSNLLAPPVTLACGGSTVYEIDSEALVYAVGYNQEGEEGAGYVSEHDISPISHDDPDGIVPESIAPDGWSATASVNSASAGNVFTGSSSWTTGGAQTNTWFQLDMGDVASLSQIRLDAGNTTNYPRSYKVAVSDNGTTWSSSIATGTGNGRNTIIAFPVARGRYIRITETATSTTPWNIAVISVLF